MKRPFRRKSAPEQTRRQRAQIDDSIRKSTSFSYHARRSDQELNVGRNEQRETPARLDRSRFGNFWLNRFGAIILLITLVVSAGNILSLSNSVKVVPLTSDAKTPMLHSQATYETAAQKIMSGSILNRNKLTVDSAKLSRDMRKQFPELATASVTVPLLAHRPIVYIQTERPVLILAASNGSYILSNSGRALVASTKLQALDSLNLPQVGDQSGLSVTVGQQVLSSQNTRFIEFVSKELATKNITISAMTLPAAASQLDIQLTGKPYSVKFNLQSNTARQQVGTFLATVSQLGKQGITPGKYIDVRVDGRAYYQ